MNNPIKATVNSIYDIAPEKRFLIDELTIVGKFIVMDDVPILRTMCNTIVDGKRTGGNLSVLDISKCFISAIDGLWEGNHFTWSAYLIDCISLKRILFPSKLQFTEKDGELFHGCKSLESISIVGTELPAKYELCGKAYDMDGVLFLDKRGDNILIKYPANKGNEYTIPDNVTKISECAFEDSHLCRLTMPAVPPTCAENAFKGVNLVAMTLVVPKGTHDSYWLHPVFGKFNIEEMDE